MKRNEFIKILTANDVVFFRSGSRHDIYRQITTGKKVSVPRHGEIDNILAKEILKELRKE
ncbi:MAG: type II toxin-antitoxin system HicA family toxin [Treponema sp.]|jgi:predicted RNA binding protein YcfA (HicA-like mRNA interferase family)|nr:type II toxin-antitoxin system HicA family toxin [Treponema sp.]